MYETVQDTLIKKALVLLQPLEFDEFHRDLKDAGILAGSDVVADFLDDQVRGESRDLTNPTCCKSMDQVAVSQLHQTQIDKNLFC